MKDSCALYIHIPFCISKCKYCDFYSSTDFDDYKITDYVDALCSEIAYRIKQFNIKEIETIYIGGGTPSLLSSLQITKLFDFLRNLFDFSRIAEITIEVNPDDISEDKLSLYKNCGISRISCGIQSLNQESLKFACRRAGISENLKAMQILESWEGQLSYDLICGLPYETKSSFVKGLEDIISHQPDHISMYSLTFESNTQFGRLLDSGQLSYDFDFSDELWLSGKNILESAGYNQYEVSNFSKKDKESKHNLFYWNHCNYLGCGCAATGTVYNEEGTGRRWTNTRNISDYIEFWNSNNIVQTVPESIENISLENSIFEFFMMGLRKTAGIKKSEFEQIFKMPVPEKIITNFEKWEQRDLCVIENQQSDKIYSLGKKGILYLNQFLTEIL